MVREDGGLSAGPKSNLKASILAYPWRRMIPEGNYKTFDGHWVAALHGPKCISAL